MLSTLRTIIHTVDAAEGLQNTFDVIVSEISRTMKTDVCSVYLLDTEDNSHLLVANTGFDPALIGKTTIPADSGVISLISNREEPLKFDDGHTNQAFYDIPGSDEDETHAFLGVPIIHHRDVLGVLVVQQKDRRVYNEQDEAFLVTLTAQLAGIIANVELRSLVESTKRNRAPTQFNASSSAPGLAVGKGWVVSQPTSLATLPIRQCKNIDDEIKQIRKALSRSRKDIRNLAYNNSYGRCC